MYDYYDELAAVRASIDHYLDLVKAGLIVIPQEELSDEETPLQWAVNRLDNAIYANIRENT